MPTAMTAITDIQKALNVIRTIEREAAAETRLAALALIAGTAADIARDLHGHDQPLNKRAGTKSPAGSKANKNTPKPLPIPQPPKPVAASTTSQALPQHSKAKPFTEPELTSANIEVKSD